MNVIEVRNLVKEYRLRKGGFLGLFGGRTEIFRALNGISLKIKKGEKVGIIGPNGSGKSTLVRILTGVMRPSKGSAEVLGLTPWEQRHELAKRIGVLFGGRSVLFPFIPAIESLLYLAMVYSVPRREAERRIEKLAKRLGAEEVLEKEPVNMSLGQRIKIELIATLLHDPELIFLDEPTIALDILAREAFLEALKEIGKNKTIVYISHMLDEVEELCDRIIILNRGNVFFDGTRDELRKKVDYKICRIMLSKPFGGSRVVEFRLRRMGLQEAIALFEPYGIRDVEIFSPPIEEVVKEFYR